MKDIIKAHKRIHGDKEVQTAKIVFSNDGIQECKSTSISLDVFAIRFEGCRQVYSPGILRIKEAGKKLAKSEEFKYFALQKVLDDFE